MNKLLSFLVLLGCFASSAQAAEDPMQTCGQIREQIKAVIGQVTSPDMGLLKKISMHQECNFSSSEAYRAAYGDNPLPQQGAQDRHQSHEREED